MPTILDLFGMGPLQTCIGHSLVPLIIGRKKRSREHAFLGYVASLAEVVNERWVYATWRGQEPPVLFDRKKDPYLAKNVATKNREVVKQHHAALMAFMRNGKTEEQFLQGWNTI
jgi:hypothetical protein